MCFGQEIWIPHALYEDGQMIKFYDSAYHKQVLNDGRSIIKCGDYDRRWLKIMRPTVVVGGELTMDNLELRHDPRSNINEAPLQMKSNCGCLLIDDFGRQRIEPAQLLNRWIVPLEMRHDFLTLPTGKKLQVPFDQLVIFSTNLEPRRPGRRGVPPPHPLQDRNRRSQRGRVPPALPALCQDLRLRIPPRGRRGSPGPGTTGRTKRRLRRCHPRDLLLQIRSYCNYARQPMEMRPEYFDRAVKTYFATVFGERKVQTT